jgi:hypothetical protein
MGIEGLELGLTGMHIFLTGAIQVGKSTAIRRFLEPHPSLTLGGFRTVSVSAAEGESDSVHIIPPGGRTAQGGKSGHAPLAGSPTGPPAVPGGV